MILLLGGWGDSKGPGPQGDSIRVYVLIDINRNAILRRLDDVIMRYGEANEENELLFHDRRFRKRIFS